MNNSVFVQIAAYRDPELLPTLKNLIENAAHPENLRIVICWQHGDDQTLEDFLDYGVDILGYEQIEHLNPDETSTTFDVIEAEYKNAKIELIDVLYSETWGTCWARNLIQTQYNNEKYTLQLDSHHRFIELWDTESINMLESIRSADTPKPILTGYIPSYNPANDPTGRVMSPWQTDFDRFIPEGAVFFLPSAMHDWKNRTTPMKGRFYSGHFAFADGTFAKEVKHDPEYFFHGEEISIAVRAFTHGYDLFMPHKIIAWHEYTRKGRAKIWGDATPEKKKKNEAKINWVERNNHCHKRNRILFGMEENEDNLDFGEYGFGKIRSLADYEKYAGIRFKDRSVQAYTLQKCEPPNPTADDGEYLPYRKEVINLHKSEIDSNIDYDFWAVILKDDNDDEVYRKDLTNKEIKKLLHGVKDNMVITVEFYSDSPIAKYIIWPYSKIGGWMKKLVKS